MTATEPLDRHQLLGEFLRQLGAERGPIPEEARDAAWNAWPDVVDEEPAGEGAAVIPS